MVFKILVLGAGELGQSVMKSLATRIRSNTYTTFDTIALSVLLRPSTGAVHDEDPKYAETLKNEALRQQNIKIVPGNIATASVEELVVIFGGFDLVVSCLGV
jgi:molybdopterin/thiamine biosynthesis adenylyltransferase